MLISVKLHSEQTKTWYKYEECKFVFNLLKHHMNPAYGLLSQCFQVLFHCETCENEFTGLRNLKKHLRLAHEARNRSLLWNSDSVNKYQVQEMERFGKFFIIVDSIHPTIHYHDYKSIHKLEKFGIIFRTLHSKERRTNQVLD